MSRYVVEGLRIEGRPAVYLADVPPWPDGWPEGARIWVLMDVAEEQSVRTYLLGCGTDVASALRAAAAGYDEATASVVH